jgi:predicted dehydrogenase
VRIVVIGTGFGARVVAPAFSATAGCEVVDVVSPRDDAAVGRAIARPDVDLVSVHSPPFLHAQHVRAIVAEGKAVLCDKPFALDAEEAAALVAEAASSGVVALCNFEFRFHPVRRLLRELVRTDALGPIEHVHWTHLSAGSRVPLRRYGWLFDRDRGGGWIGAWGSHAVDTIRWCFGEIVEVDAQPRLDVVERPDDHGELHACTAEDGLTATLRLERGATIAIDSSFAASASVAPRLTVLGAEATCEIVADARVVLRRGDGTSEDLTPKPTPGDDGRTDRHAEPMHRFAEVVRDVVTSAEVPPGVPTFADGLACDLVLDQLRAAPILRADRQANS